MKEKDVKIAFKKPNYPISEELYDYLEKYGRTTKTSVFYDDLLRFSGFINLEDSDGNDTLWHRVYYPEFDRQELETNINKIYTLLHSDGDVKTLPYFKS